MPQVLIIHFTSHKKLLISDVILVVVVVVVVLDSFLKGPLELD